MKFGYTIAVGNNPGYPALQDGDVIENIKNAAYFHPDSVEIHLADPEDLDVDTIIELCSKENIKVSALGTGLSCGKYGLSLTDENIEIRDKTRNKLKEYINVANRLNCSVIIGSIRGKKLWLPTKEKYEEFLIKEFKSVVNYAEEIGVTLVFETINRYELPYYNNVKDMADLIRKIDSENVKIHIDSFHMNIEDSSISEAIEYCKEILGHVHVADNTRMYPGTGTFNFTELLHSLKKIGYMGSVSMECSNKPEPEVAIKNGLAYLQNIYKNLIMEEK